MWRYINGANIYWLVKCSFDSNHLEFTEMLICCWGMSFLIRIETPPEALCPSLYRWLYDRKCFMFNWFLTLGSVSGRHTTLGLYLFKSGSSSSLLALIPLQIHCKILLDIFYCI